MVLTCNVDFNDNPNAIFRSGQTVSGTVVLILDKPKDVKAVLLRVFGSTDTRWSEHKGGGTQIYCGHEKYLKNCIYFVGSKEANKCTLPAGTHQYNFSFDIPQQCPTSFEGSHGRIRYTVKVVLLRPWKFDQTFTKGMTVVKEKDLNDCSPQIQRPLYAKGTKTFWNIFPLPETLNLAVTLAQSGFVSGQYIPIEVIATNDSSMTVKKLKASLQMVVKYYHKPQSRKSVTERKVISKVKGGSVLSHCTKRFDYDLPIPATTPTCTGDCGIIEITYEVQVTANFKGLHTSQVVCVPVIIGTVPLRKTCSERDTKALKESEILSKTTGAEASGCTEEDLPSYNTFLPSYEEAVHLPRTRIDGDEQHDYGQRDFAPCYPVFNMLNNMTSMVCTENIDNKKQY